MEDKKMTTQEFIDAIKGMTVLELNGLLRLQIKEVSMQIIILVMHIIMVKV